MPLYIEMPTMGTMQHRESAFEAIVGTALLTVIGTTLVTVLGITFFNWEFGEPGFTLTLSWWRLVGTWPLFVLLILRTEYGIPPPSTSLGIRNALDLTNAALILAIAFLVAPRVEWTVGLGFGGSFFCLAVTVLSLWLTARRWFYLLPELHVGLPADPPLGSSFLAAHITDVHVTKTEDVPRIENGRKGGYRPLVRFVEEACGDPPRWIFITGDLTDTGSGSEWARVREALRPAVAAACVVICPGNHDLLPVFGGKAADKLRRFLTAAAGMLPGLQTAMDWPVAAFPERVHAETEPLIPAHVERLRQKWISEMLQGDLGDIRPDLRRPPAFLEGVLRRSREKEKQEQWQKDAKKELTEMWYLENWYTLFPLVVDSDGVRVLVLNSIPADADTLGENALGWCGDAQLERLEQMLMNLPVGTRLVFVLMHHAPFRAPGDRLFGGLRSIRHLVDRTEAFGFLSHKPDEASRITVILSSGSERNPGVKYLLLCGHRHRGGLCRIGLTLVLEGASLAEERGHPWWLFEQGPGLFASAERTPSLAGEREAGGPYRG